MPVPSRLLKVGVVLLYCRFRGRKMMSPCPLKPFKDRILEQSIPELSNYCRHGFLMFFFCLYLSGSMQWLACLFPGFGPRFFFLNHSVQIVGMLSQLATAQSCVVNAVGMGDLGLLRGAGAVLESSAAFRGVGSLVSWMLPAGRGPGLSCVDGSPGFCSGGSGLPSHM